MIRLQLGWQALDNFGVRPTKCPEGGMTSSHVKQNKGSLRTSYLQKAKTTHSDKRAYSIRRRANDEMAVVNEKHKAANEFLMEWLKRILDEEGKLPAEKQPWKDKVHTAEAARKAAEAERDSLKENLNTAETERKAAEAARKAAEAARKAAEAERDSFKIKLHAAEAKLHAAEAGERSLAEDLEQIRTTEKTLKKKKSNKKKRRAPPKHLSSSGNRVWRGKESTASKDSMQVALVRPTLGSSPSKALKLHDRRLFFNGPAPDKTCTQNEVGSPGGTCECPEGKVCDIECKGNHACRGATFVGTFRNVFCDGKDACRELTSVVKAKSVHCKGIRACIVSAGFEIAEDFTCDGQDACKGLKSVVKAKSVHCKGSNACIKSAGFEIAEDLTCDGQLACNGLKSVVKAKSVHCKGEYACSGFAGFEIAEDFTCDGPNTCLMAKQLSFAGIAYSPHLKIVNGASFPSNLVGSPTFKQLQVEGRHPEAVTQWTQCNTEYFCPLSANRCSATPCPTECKTAVGTQVEHNLNNVQQQIDIEVHAATNYAVGYQPLAAKQSGALTTIRGTLYNARQSDNFVMFRLPNVTMAPSCPAEFLSVAAVGNSLEVFVVTLESTAHALIKVDHALGTALEGKKAVVLSISQTLYVPYNVPSSTSPVLTGHKHLKNSRKILEMPESSEVIKHHSTASPTSSPTSSPTASPTSSPTASPTASPTRALTSEIKYHLLDMGNGAVLCVLQGSVILQWPGRSPVSIAKIDDKCTKDNANFRIAAHVRNATGHPQWLDAEGMPRFQLMINGAGTLQLWSASTTQPTKVTVFLDGVVLGSRTTKDCQSCVPTEPQGMPTLCNTGTLAPTIQASTLIEGRTGCSSIQTQHECLSQYTALGCTWDPSTNKCTGGKEAGVRTYAIGESTSTDPVAAADAVTADADKSMSENSVKGGQSGCSNVLQHRVVVEDSSVTGPLLKLENLLIMGDTLQSRTCMLRGVAEFEKINGDWVAQIDPNVRDPKVKAPLCFVLNTMVFPAGVVTSTEGQITQLIAIQLEPQGTIRVTTKLNKEPANLRLHLRLDGNLYHPFMPALKPPTTNCAPYCFPAKMLARDKMSPGTSCVKYCTPQQLDPDTRKPLDCKCDMLKRIDCWKHKGSLSIRCGQYKQLLGQRYLNMTNQTMIEMQCAAICARQLSSF
jgi:chemotaxis protein histidine kinase CheA